MKPPSKKLWVVIALLLCAGCASIPPTEKTIARKTTASKPAPVNLAGFPAGYKEGYNDACASVKDYKRYKADQQYKQGWQDGSFTCKKK